ncbi:ATP-dependent helicase [Paenibacillus tarimensis]|uniref:ATP-dependent helicase n=1 Tax=Paenibacillus tarimensis TaxID=416012 RepID=UPI001F2594C7|nr:ATP-dependent helicase [Paenibacillus tarimensis]MCF2945287.1 ATP-dependent helicase [Paenibacillus tarimensis]
MQAEQVFFERKHRELGVSLNEVQKQAVLTTEGPLLLLASPGSGKTTTMIMRMGYLVEVKGVDPSRLKAVTFSRASAHDMKERFKRFFPGLPAADFSTIHSFAFEVVRQYFWRARQEYVLIEGHAEQAEEDGEEEQQPGVTGKPGQYGGQPGQLPLNKKLILRSLYETITGSRPTDDQMEELTSYISFIKNKMIPPAEWAAVRCGVPQAKRVMEAYESYKQTGGQGKLLLDYDDMLTVANRLLEEDESLLRSYQKRYDYILTDESQDTSLVQHALIEKLVRPHGNLCVVADDDQSIYTWRAAEPQYLLDFKKVYPNAEILFMEQNYRSTAEIVKVANRFIKRNKNRYNKNMFTRNPPGQPISIRTLDDFRQQSKYVVQELQKLEQLGEAAVLYRNNSSSISLMNELDRAGVPYYMKDADNRFFSHWVVEDVLNFMRMSYTDRRADLLEKIHTKLSGYITRHQITVLKEINNNESVFDNLLRFVHLQDYQRKLLQDCKANFERMRGMAPLAAIHLIRNQLGYDKAVEKLCERLGFQRDYLVGILNTLEDIAEPLPTMEAFAQRLQHLEESLKKARSRRGQNAVTLSTFHSSKGLEFEHVYMVDLIEGVIPSADDIEQKAEGNGEPMEEAVRLFYVGMTRAKKYLELIAYKERNDTKVQESRFVTGVRYIMNPPEDKQAGGSGQAAVRAGAGRGPAAGSGTVSAVPRSSAVSGYQPLPEVPYNPNAIKLAVELQIGRQVKHRVFGHGEIAEVTDGSIVIRFPGGLKKLQVRACLELGLLEPASDAG